MFKTLLSKLKKSREYRSGFVAAQIDVLIPFQIRALRKQYGLEQKDLAELTGMKQPSISKLEKAGNRPNIETLKRIADGFDVALIIKFVPFSELVRWADNFSPDEFTVPNFSSEVEKAEAAGSVRNGNVPKLSEDRLISCLAKASWLVLEFNQRGLYAPHHLQQELEDLLNKLGIKERQ